MDEEKKVIDYQKELAEQLRHLKLSDETPNGVIVVKHKVKNVINHMDKTMKMSDKAWSFLQYAVFEVIARAVEKAQKDKRKIVMDRDFFPI